MSFKDKQVIGSQQKITRYKNNLVLNDRKNTSPH